MTDKRFNTVKLFSILYSIHDLFFQIEFMMNKTMNIQKIVKMFFLYFGSFFRLGSYDMCISISDPCLVISYDVLQEYLMSNHTIKHVQIAVLFLKKTELLLGW